MQNQQYVNNQTAGSLHLNTLAGLLTAISPAGRRLKQQLTPYYCGNEAQLTAEYKRCDNLIGMLKANPHLSEQLSGILGHIEDVFVLIDGLNKQRLLEIYEIFELKSFCWFYRQLWPHILLLQDDAPDLAELFTWLDPQKQDTPVFALDSFFDDQINPLRQQLDANQQEFTNLGQAYLQQAKQQLNKSDLQEQVLVSRLNTSLTNLLQGSGFYNKIEENFAHTVFKLRYTPAQLQLEAAKSGLEHKLELAQERARRLITTTLASWQPQLKSAWQAVASFDWLLAKANFALKYNCCIPTITPNAGLSLQQAVNIPLKLHLQQRSLHALSLDFATGVNAVTGANMAGKSTLLALCGQVLWLAGYGVPIPAKSATIGLVDFIFASGVYQGGDMDLSSFGCEITSLDNALKQPGRGLYLLDEFARGTNPEEGAALAAAVLGLLSQKPGLCLAVTHFSQALANLKGRHYRVIGINNSKLSKLKFDHDSSLEARLKRLEELMDYGLQQVDPNSPPPKQALLVAQALGVDNNLLAQARKLLGNLNE